MTMQYQINHITTDDVKARMTTRTDQMRAWLEELARASERTLAGWDGDAQQAYWAAKSEWDSGANAAQDIVTRKIITLGNINDNYRQGDQSAARGLH
jgi:6 kDa early secretory antigenic target